MRGFKRSTAMFRRTTYLILGIALMSISGWAQSAQPTAPRENQMYCGGVVTDKVQKDSYVISGAESDSSIVFTDGDDVFISKGSSSGVKVGDQFIVTRVETDP